jgi:predicted cupin superfamily sugar epimerase
MNSEARQVIARLGLAPLPHEGGYFREIWTSSARLPSGRGMASAIYFLLMPNEFSAFHRMAAEELWNFHSGDPVEHVQLDAKTGGAIITRLGPEILNGDRPWLVVPGNVWQGARIVPGGGRGWALVSCGVAPAWDRAEFELGNASELRRLFPANDGLVRELTR